MKIILGIILLVMLTSTMVWADESPGIVWKWFFTDGYAYHYQYRTSGTLLIFIYQVTELGSYIFERTVFCRWDQPLSAIQ